MSLTLKVDKASQFEEKACLKWREIINSIFEQPYLEWILNFSDTKKSYVNIYRQTKRKTKMIYVDKRMLFNLP